MINLIKNLFFQLSPRFLVSLIMLALTTGCGITPVPEVGPLTIQAEKKLPDLEIVFYEAENLLGFIDPDGTQYIPHAIDLSGWYHTPGVSTTLIEFITWDSPGEMLVGGYTGRHRSSNWPIVLTSEGDLFGCSPEVSPYSPYRNRSISESRLIAVDESMQEGRVVIFDVSKCEIVETLYSVSDARRESLSEAALSSQGWLAIGRFLRSEQQSGDELVLQEPDGTIAVSIPGANYPSWSKDGEWVAFNKWGDGLYIARKDGSEMRQVVSGLMGRTLTSWSPDGKWLVYDRMVADSEGHSTSVIYKVNIESGLQVELHRGGYNPSWRWGS